MIYLILGKSLEPTGYQFGQMCSAVGGAHELQGDVIV